MSQVLPEKKHSPVSPLQMLKRRVQSEISTVPLHPLTRKSVNKHVSDTTRLVVMSVRGQLKFYPANGAEWGVWHFILFIP